MIRPIRLVGLVLAALLAVTGWSSAAHAEGADGTRDAISVTITAEGLPHTTVELPGSSGSSDRIYCLNGREYQSMTGAIGGPCDSTMNPTLCVLGYAYIGSSLQPIYYVCSPNYRVAGGSSQTGQDDSGAERWVVPCMAWEHAPGGVIIAHVSMVDWWSCVGFGGMPLQYGAW